MKMAAARRSSSLKSKATRITHQKFSLRTFHGPFGSAHRRRTEPARLFDALSDMVDAKAIERGETDRIWRMVWELQSGNVG